jgi:DNA-binding response OmpR family regulator
MIMFQVLVVEDDTILRELFCNVLMDHGYTPVPARDGLEAFDILDNTHIDLIITDVMMPRMDGFSFTRALREAKYTTPVLIITAKHTPEDKQQGFRAGTDDYMVKPIDVNEMIWRVEALLRRSQLVNQRKTLLGNTEFRIDDLMVCRNGENQALPQKEFFLLFKLVSSPGRTFTRRQILEDVWDDADVDPHTLDVHISRLRERFKDNPDFEIVTVRGLGYKAVAKI